MTTQYQNDAEELKKEDFAPGAGNISEASPEEQAAAQPAVDGFRATDAGPGDAVTDNKAGTQANDNPRVSDGYN